MLYLLRKINNEVITNIFTRAFLNKVQELFLKSSPGELRFKFHIKTLIRLVFDY